ncbi:hypothetical protein LOD99_5665 [Oopsacas minuta]|uniref:MULE transposase domain-containing protein n=1 Tax=Oopsacas minuta TaxID=111878 RepID=A0AAV7JQ16_9METZ|nr:hypothetical protein LOD99_5665 [Oopsacas minuta]
MLLDIEKGPITSFEHVWPNTVVKCCFFHLTQNFWRHVQSVGLQSAYTHDEELAMCIRRIPALAFARPADVHDLFDQVAMDLPLTSEIGELVDYFERTYIGRTLASGYHVAATFPIDLWNYHLSTPFGLLRRLQPYRLHMSPEILCEVEEAALHYCVRPDMLKAGNRALLNVQEHLLRLDKWTQ